MEQITAKQTGADMVSDTVAAERRAKMKSLAAASRKIIEDDAAVQTETLRDAVRSDSGRIMTAEEALRAIQES